MSNITNEKYVDDVCKMGQGADCCRYLGRGEDGWECFKESGLKATIDARVDMTAKSDNCKGFEIEHYDITKQE